MAATGLACAENTTIICTVPASADARVVSVGVSVNGDDEVGAGVVLNAASTGPRGAWAAGL